MSICIAGMHRSGTSMVARLLNICGLYLGEKEDIMKPQRDNPEGFWENNLFVEINDKILSSNGYGWDFPPANYVPNLQNVSVEIQNKAKTLIESMEANDPWGWKDPRNSLNLSFWKELIPDLKVIVCLRNPLEVAMSLQKRGNNSYSFSFNLWYVYNKKILENIEKDRMIITHYDSFFINPVYEIKRLLNFSELNIDDDKIVQACSSISGNLRHHFYSEIELSEAGASKEILELYNEMCRASGPVFNFSKIKDLHEKMLLLNDSKENLTDQSISVNTNFTNKQHCLFKKAYCEDKSHIVKGMTSIIIPVFNKIEYTKKCLQAIRKNTPEGKYEIIVINNASTDETGNFLKSLGEQVKVITNTKNMGFTLASNQGAKIAAGEFVLFLNNDTEPQKFWLESMIELMESDDKIGITGSKLIYPDGRLQEAGGIIFSDGSGWNYGRFDNPFNPKYNYVREVDYVSGASLMIRNSLLKQLNYFDEQYSPGYYEDTDLCFGARSLGYKVMYCPFSIVIHHEGISSGTDLKSGMKKFQLINKEKFVNKWKEDLKKQYLPDKSNVISASERNTRGNILIIDPFLPQFDRASGSLRLFTIIKILKEQNYHITYIARNGRGQQKYERILNVMGVEVYSTDPERLKKLGIHSSAKEINIGEILTVRHYDIAILSFYEIAIYYLDIIRRFSPLTKIIIDTVDIHFVREIRMAETNNDKKLLKKAYKTKEDEISIYRKADALITVTEKDWDHISKYLSGIKNFVIPNIHNISENYVDLDKRNGLLFIGNFNHPPNADAVFYFVDSIFPILKKKLPDITITIVGNNPPEDILKLHNENINVTGYVPSTEPYLNAARVSVAPLRYGAGMKGKIGEAMAYGLPVVTTSIGAEGMGLRDFETVMIADSPEEFAEKIFLLYTNNDLWLKISESGRKFIKNNYSVEKISKIIEEILEDLIKEKSIIKLLPDEKQIIKGLTSIIILTFNEIKYTKQCFDSITKYTSEPYEIVFIDNGSTDGTVKWLRELAIKNQNIKIFENKTNLGFAKGCNQGINLASGEYVLLLNNDIIVTEGWLSGMLECLQKDSFSGIVGPMTNNISGSQRVVDYKDISVDNLPEYSKVFRERNRNRRIFIRRIAGFCMLFRYDLIRKIGMLDESFGSGNYEDDDICLRAILAGYKNYIAGDVFIYHYGSRSFKGNGIDYRKAMERNQKIFNNKWTIENNGEHGRNLYLIKLLEKADILRQKGKFEESISEYIKAIQINPEDTRSYYAFAEMLIGEHKFEDALNILKQAPLHDEDFRTIFLKAQCFEGLNLIKEAEEHIEKILFKDKSNAYALNLKGQIAYKKGNIKEAEDLFKLSSEIDASYGEPFTNLGVIKWTAGQTNEALNLTERGFILSPDCNDITTIYYSIVSATGEYQRCEKILKEAKALYSNKRQIAFLLIDVLIKQGKNAEALNYIQEAIITFGKDDGIIDAALEIRKRIEAENQHKILEIDEKEKKTKKTLSLCMIVKNEENTLIDCLNSIKNVVDEIIIVDTGSTDRTKDIAKIYGAKIYDFKWTGDFSEARNYSLSKANCDWILILDADEVISPIDHDRLKELINKKQNVAYSITTRNYVNAFNLSGWTSNGSIYSREEKGKGWFPSTKVRLFPNKKGIKFYNKVHELVEPSLRGIGIQTKNCDVPIHHYGKLNDTHVMEKGEDYYKLGVQKQEGAITDLKSIYELAIQAGELDRHQEAIELWKKLLQANSSLSDDILLKAYVNMGHAYFHLGMYKEAYDVSKKAYFISPDSQDAIMNYCLSEVWIGEAEKAIAPIKTLLQKKPDFPQGIGLLGIAYIIKGEEQKAYEYLVKIKKKGFNCSKFIYDHAKILASTGKYEYSVLLIRKAVEMNLLDEQLQKFCEENMILKI